MTSEAIGIESEKKSDRDKLNDLKKQRKEEMKKQKSEKFVKKQQFTEINKKCETNPKSTVLELEKIEYISNAPSGEKKDTKCCLPEKYSSLYVEAAWYAWWQKKGFFKPDYKYSMSELANLPSDKKFIVLIPPPNVTGTLHIGHALMCTLEDVLCRWNRMNGKAVLWIPGCDHAGIATQVVVEKKLKREKNLSRHELGREKFVQEIWKWKSEKGIIIYDQLKRMGISVDWERVYFTMDEPRSKAVTEAFVRLYEKKMIYRAKRLVNWSCSLKSAISDIEVEKLELDKRQLLSVPGYNEKVEFGLLVEFSYKLSDSDERITVATTRIETMLGDVAIAVHPNDSRYKNMIGKYVIHPFSSRKLIIIADSAVDPSFGTGAVKITPAHDQVDYEIGLRHNLEVTNIFTEDGCIIKDLDVTPDFNHFRGIHRFQARKIVLNELKRLNLFIRSTDHPMVIPICSRSKDVIEPLLKSQWYVSCEGMAKQAIECVRDGELKIVPPHHERTWYYWMENIKDWCVSRQLWWGHRIPAYYVTSLNPLLKDSDPDNSFYWISARSKQAALILAEEKFKIPAAELILKEDEDVLDTWFSSGVLPFSIFGWPNETDEFKALFPTTLLETGYDILFFWVARMVMLSQQLTGTLPFKEILLHSIIRDSHGRKMSKSLGNIIDPVDVIQGITLENLQNQLLNYNLDSTELMKASKGQKKDFPNGIPECGTDALRFTLCAYAGSAKDINLDILRVQGYRFFCNKIWNAIRFCLINFGSEFSPSKIFPTGNESPMDNWILSRLTLAEQTSNDSFAKYDFPSITSAIYNFWLYDLCDIYIESLKPILTNGDATQKLTSLNVIFTCIDAGLRLLHPFMPFITEELFQRLPFAIDHFNVTPSICVASYPCKLPWRNVTLEKEVELIMAISKEIRSARDDYLPSKSKTDVFLHISDDKYALTISNYSKQIETLSNTSNLVLIKSTSEVPKGCAIATYRNICYIYILLKGRIDIPKEVTKIETKLKLVEINLTKLQDLMNVPDYSKKVPTSVQETNTQKENQYAEEINHLKSIVKNLKIAED